VLLGPALAVHVANGVRSPEVVLAPPVAGDLAHQIDVKGYGPSKDQVVGEGVGVVDASVKLY